MANRKVPVTITHRLAGIQPPLFVAGTFSDPEWEPHEMDFTVGSGGEHHFSKDFEAEPNSKIQYKFRVGHGDWWMLDEDAPTVTDEAGNRNNLIEAPPLQGPKPTSEPAAESATESDVAISEFVSEPTDPEPMSKPIQEPTPESTPEPAAEPVEELILELTPEPTPEPAVELAAEPTHPESISELIEESTPQPAAELISEPIEEPAAEPISEPIEELIPETVEELTPEPAAEPAHSQTVAEPISEPIEELIPETAEELTPEPAAEPAHSETVAEPVEEPIEEPILEPAPEPIEEPVEDLTPEPTPEPASEPAHPEPIEEATYLKPASESSPESALEPTLETSSEPVEQPAEEPAMEPSLRSVEEPVEEPAAEPAEELISESISEPVEEAVEEPVEPISEPAAEPTPELISEPVEEPAAEPVEETAVEPISDLVPGPAAEQIEEPAVERAPEPISELLEETVAEPILEPNEPDDLHENDTQNDIDDYEERLQPNPQIDALKLSDKVERSGTSTPEYARTAAEVADSAAWVDPATPEPEVSDEVAAETGYRQMTSTPPQEAADTAAEVADTAKALDTEQARVPIEIPSPPHKTLANVKDDMKDESLDIAGYSNDPDAVPLFAHECAGIYEDDEIPGADGAEQQTESLNGGLHQHGEEDFGDPTLERFPSTRDEIMTTVRKVESGLNADETSFEGTPPSPVVRERTSSIVDVPGESQSSDESPKLTSGPRRLSMPRPGSRESISERSLSAVSLGSIAEGAEEEDVGTDKAEGSKAEGIAPVAEHAETAEEVIKVAKKAEGDVSLAPEKPALRPVVTVPSPSVQASNNNLLSPVSDEDEAISIHSGKGKNKSAETEHSGYLTPERAATPKLEEPGSPREPAPNVAAPIVELDADTVDLTAEAEPAMAIPPSPKIVVSKAEDIQPPEEELPQAASSSSEDGPKDIETPRSSSSETETEARTETAATSSAVEDIQPGSLRKRAAPQTSPTDRAGTPGSITETGREAAKSGNWFTAFFRLLFVDWVGGFVSSLCGRRRKTLIATGVALVALGAAWYSQSDKLRV